MRIGLVGLGRIGAFHAGTLSGLPEVTELVVTDAVPAVTARVAREHGAEPVADPATLLRSGVDGVVIATATDAHPQLILAAVEAGLPVFCEKPVARAAATGSTRGDAVFAEIGDAATSAAVLTLDDDTLAVVSNTRFNGRGYDVRLEVHGSAGSSAAGPEDVTGPAHTFFIDRFAEAYRRELAAFIEVVAGTRESPCTVADAVEAGWIAEACTVSWQEHRPVRVSEVRSTA